MTRDQGFTLVETLVAFVVTSLVLAALYAALGGSVRRLADADRRGTTLALAQSHLDRLTASRSLPVGATAGDYPDRTRWRLTARALPVAGPFDDITARPVHLQLDVLAADGRLLLQLETVALTEAVTEGGL